MLKNIITFLFEQWFVILLFLFSTWLSYLFWKNPIDNDIHNPIHIKDNNGLIRFIIGERRGKWIIQKINRDTSGNIPSGEKSKSYATIKNNNNIKIPPKTIEDLEKLNYQ